MFTPLAHGGGELVEHRLGGGPVHAGVGDALAVGEWHAGFAVLAAFDEMALDHDAGDGFAASGELFAEGGADERLLAVVFEAVAVAAINHDAGGKSACGELVGGGLDRCCVEVGAGFASAQDDVAGVVPFGVHDSGDAVFGD